MRNLEVKQAVDDLSEIRHKALQAGGRPAGTLRQSDTFYRVERGLLKLRRIEGAPAELIAYDRPLTAGSRISDYLIHTTAAPDTLDQVLSRALTPLVTVTKTRELIMLGGTRIHLDQVEGLGTFVELETEGNTRPDEAVRAEHDWVIEALGLDRTRFLPGSYAAMLLGRDL